jgi:hypothetical protein
MPIQNLTTESIAQFRQTTRRAYDMNIKHEGSDYITLGKIILYDGSPINKNIIEYYDFDIGKSEYKLQLMQLEKGVDVTVIDITKDIDRLNDYEMITKVDTITNVGNDTVISNTAYKGIWTVNAESGSPTSIDVEKMIGNYYEGDYFYISQNAQMMTLRGVVDIEDLMRLTADVTEDDTALSCTGTLTYSYQPGSEILFNARPVQIRHELDTSAAVTEYANAYIPDPAILSFTAIKRKIRVVNNGVDMNPVETLANYNDFKVSAGKIEFNQNMQNEKIIIEFEKWEDLL